MTLPIAPSTETHYLIEALRLQLEWGVDCALDDHAIDRFDLKTPTASPIAVTREPKLPQAAAPTASRVQDTTENLIRSAQTLEAYAAALASLTSFPLARTATHAVLPKPAVGARLMIVGDAPQASEDRSGIVFDGPENALLDKLLASIALTRENVSLAPALPWRPPGGREVSPPEMAYCRPLLEKAIALCRPEKVLLLGLTPARILFGTGLTLGAARGKWHDLDVSGLGQVPIRVTRHPLQIAASPRARRDVWADLLTIAEALEL